MVYYSSETPVTTTERMFIMNEIAEMYASYPDMLSPLQLMEMLCISKTSTYRLLSENVIPHLKMGRIYRIPKA